MHVSRLYIKNFRSIEQLDILLHPGKNVIVGRNNVGKSNIVRALDLVFGERSPSYAKAENVAPDDFRHWRITNEEGEVIEQSASELLIWCELERAPEEILDYDSLYGIYGFYRLNARIPKESLPHDVLAAFEKQPDDFEKHEKTYVNPKLRNQQTLEQELGNMNYFAFAFAAHRNAEGYIEKDIRLFYRESDQVDWLMAFKANVRTELLQSAIIPSFRDPATQLRATQWTWYGKLMRHLVSHFSQQDKLDMAMADMASAADEAFAQVGEDLAASSLDVAFPGTTVHLAFHAPARDQLYRNCTLLIDDGFRSELDRKGAGVQSATVIGLFSYYTRHVNTKSSALLCIEEPEVYLHPHARRVVSSKLGAFLAGGRNQVVLTTHSPEFVVGSGDSSLVLVRREGRVTTASTIDLAPYRRTLLAAEYAEVFFADSVILCEGHDKYLIELVAENLFPSMLDIRNVTIIDAEGKDGIVHVAKLLLRLQIPCYILADFDFLLRDKSENCREFGGKPHASLVDLGRRFFRQACISGNKGDAVHKGLNELRNELREENKEAFYSEKSRAPFVNDRLPKAVSYLRDHGVCILDAEVEDLLAPGVLQEGQKKLSRRDVQSIKNQVEEGTALVDLVDISSLQDLLGRVFDST